METTHIKIFSETPIIINRLRSLLEEQNIGSLVKNQFESGRLAGFGAPMNAVDLFILNSDLEKASIIVDDFKKEISS
ncbi:MAG: DUF2007 domain-containing protein [Flavobacteriaceae bacterium]|jgi:hypothetical protein|tara:strand:+ start:1638 stop:1868 length:231 start_codon:yes stop_codon:yes gene_type:complete